jgi:hypothetical protein
MDRLESNEVFPFAWLNSRADSSTPSVTKPFSAVWRAIPSAGLCLLALTWPAVARAANFSVCASGCDQTTVAAAVAAAASGDTIVIAPGTYAANIEIPANVVLTLQGAGAGVTILDGGGQGPVLIVDFGATVTLQSVTVQHGGNPKELQMGGIVAYGNLTVSDSLITGNSVGLATIGGDAQVVRTTISNNQSDDSGAAAGVENVGGQTALVQCTIAANYGQFVGGIGVESGVVSLMNSTASGNTGYEVANIEAAQGSVLSLVSSTVVNAYTGVSSQPFGAPSMFFYSGGSISNSIFSSSGGAANCMGTTALLSLGHNLSSDNTCGLSHPTDMNNNASINLGPLQVNSPGTTATHALLAGSAAIDAGDCSNGLTGADERSVSRPQGPACDIGAYELRLPIANDDAYSLTLGSNLVVPPPGILSNDISPDGLPLFVISESSPAHGALTYQATGALVFTPNPGYTGRDSATYELWDGGHVSNLATITFNVLADTTPPITQPDNYSVLEGQVLTINAAQGLLANDTDPDGDILSVLPTTLPANGTLQLALDGSFTYTPTRGFNGIDTFTYSASDGHTTSAPTLVTITVKPNFGTITIALSTQPQSSSAFSFTSSLGNFTLGGSFPSSKTFEVSAGTWSITELRPRPWLLPNIVCNAGAGVFVDLTNNNLQLVLNDGATMSCTFVNQLPGQISARAYFDLNADGQRESGEPWLRGWTMQLFLNPTVPVGSGVTGLNGAVWFPSLQAQIYTVCEVPPAGWQSTNPPAINPMYGKPCMTVNLNPGQSLPVLFGNTK